jgi:hypothetical protein
MTTGQVHVESEPMLAVELDVPVVELSELCKHSQRWLNWLVRLLYEAVPLAIVAGFFWLEVQVDTAMTDPAKTLVLLLLMVFELGLIFAWSLLRNLVSHS